MAVALGECIMHVPGLLERVRLMGLDEVYLVTRVDQRAQVADLLPIIYGQWRLDSVPFLAMEPMPGGGPPEWGVNGNHEA
jgi:hypothetical protein